MIPEPIVAEISKDVVIDRRARDWCKLPYPNHPKGCPNYDKRSNCPPHQGFFEDVFDLPRPIYMVAIPFDILSYMERMKTLHPQWSPRQCRCVLYWQGKVRKALKSLMVEVRDSNGCNFMTDCPEAMGVNVIKTARKKGVSISVKPKNIVWKIGFVGSSTSVPLRGQNRSITI